MLGRTIFSTFLMGLMLLSGSPSLVFAQQTAPIHVTVLVASRQGSDFDLDNDAYRDQLIQLFSYSSYHQKKELRAELKKAERTIIPLPDGFELVLTLQGQEEGRIFVQALIRKGRKQYVDSTLSILTPGVVFLGGPAVQDGTLIIVLESH